MEYPDIKYEGGGFNVPSIAKKSMTQFVKQGMKSFFTNWPDEKRASMLKELHTLCVEAQKSHEASSKQRSE